MIDRVVSGKRRAVSGGQRAAAVRWAVIALVLVAAAWLAPLTALGVRRFLPVFVLPMVAVAIVALLRWPNAAFSLVVVVSLLVPFSIQTGSETGINASVLLIGALVALWSLEMVARKHEIWIVGHSTARPLIALMVVSLLSLAFGQIPWLPMSPAPISAQVAGLAILLLCPAAFLLSAHRLRSLKAMQWMTWLFVGLGSAFLVTLFVPSLSRVGISVFQRAVRDSLFWTWMATISYSQSLLNRKLPMRWRLALGIVAFGSMYSTIVVRQVWTSGWLPALVSILVITAIVRPKLAVAFGAALGLAILLQPGLLPGVFLRGDNQFSLTTRVAAWGVLWEIIRLNPILGIGPANYHSYTPLFDILGYSANFSSHNNYVDIVAQTGVAGLVCFLWFVWEIAKLIWRLKSKVPEGFPRAYVIGAMGALAGTLVAGMLGDWILPFVYNVGLEGFRASGLAWMFLGAVVALGETCLRPNETSASSRHTSSGSS